MLTQCLSSEISCVRCRRKEDGLKQTLETMWQGVMSQKAYSRRQTGVGLKPSTTMRTRHTDATRMWRCVPLVLILSLCALSAYAQVPEATIERIVTLNVQTAEGNYLWHSGQMDEHAWRLRQNAIDAELSTLSQHLQQFSADDQKQADTQIQGLLKTRLATLKPQWEARAAALQRQREQHDRAVMESVTTDARAALEPQRRRILLQQRRDRGEITAAVFAAEDKKALDDIMAIRGKYVSEGQRYVDSFDHQLEMLTQAIAKNPATPFPVARTKAGSGGPGGQSGTSAADYQHDVALAADLNARWNEVRNRYWVKKDIPIATLRESEKILSTDLSRLNAKWQAAGKGREFARDYGKMLGAKVAKQFPPVNSGRDSKSVAGTGYAFPGFIVIAVAAGICLLILLSRKAVQHISTNYGTAHYTPQRLDIEDEKCLASGLFFGKSSTPERVAGPLESPGAPVCAIPEHHTLIVARTRTGKGTPVIVPTLLRYSGSAFVIDPKGENAAITARVRSQMVQGNLHWVRILNPWNVLDDTYQVLNLGKPATYNPLDILERSDPNAVAVAQALAGAVCPSASNAKDRFWLGAPPPS